MAKIVSPPKEPPELPEEGSFSSPPCFMHEVAPEYLGYMSNEEAEALLEELRTALERDGEDRGVLAEMLREHLPRVYPSCIRDALERLLQRCETR